MKTKVGSFDDIVFENRNQDYGAYELRKKYSKRGTLALAVSVFLLFSAVGGPLIAGIMSKNDFRGYITDEEGRAMADLNEKELKVTPPPPPPPPTPVKEFVFVAPTIVDSLSNEEVELETAGDIFSSGNSKLDDTTTYVANAKEVIEDIIIEKTVEIFELNEKPIFPDGDAGLIKFVSENTKYPIPALEGSIEGTVYIRFVVTKNGNIGDAKVMRGADPLLDEEALRVVKTLPKWIPGKINGNAVNVWFIIPVKFKLQ